MKRDIEILEEKFSIITFDFYTEKKWQILPKFFEQFFFLLRNIRSSDVVVVQFAAYHSLLPVVAAKVFAKPSYVIVGGTDAHYFPGIGYGNWQKKYLKTFTQFTFQFCSHIVPKHASLMKCSYGYDKNEPAEQGILARMPGLKTPFTTIPNGFDAEKWKCRQEKSPNTFITVSGAWEYAFQQQLKGIDLILQVAQNFPHCSFIVLGLDDENRIPQPPKNVELMKAVQHEKLVDIFSKCEFYLQLSMAEGFPNAICEAMLCECVPIGSNVFSIPEIVGDCGFVLQHRSAKELEQTIETALKCNRKLLGAASRDRIKQRYTIQHRAHSLLKLLGN